MLHSSAPSQLRSNDGPEPLQTVPSEEEIARLEQKQRQAFQERVLKDISNPLLVKTNDRISQMQDWKNNVALLSPRVHSAF
jgi:uncharacterized coiled-coil protein SlyX